MNMPEWLSKKENYIPQADKDTFINKSIMSLLNILSRIRNTNACTAEGFHISAVLKVAFTFLLIVLISVSRSSEFIIIVIVYLISVLSSMKAYQIIKTLKVSFLISVFTIILLLPSAFLGNYYSIFMITPKVFATITAVNILSYSTSWNSITNALKVFFVPDIFILVLDITIKYIFLLGDFSLNMLYSLKLRSVGRNTSKYMSLSGIAGTMFIKSREMAEEMYSAMECRGFTGEYRAARKILFSLADIIYIIINILLIFVFCYFSVI
ncbi:cobalt/nickel transport system permease protein [Ruminiclostridium sufflavum DSM 19573]|uniref:Cobalt/nickel transport system permease protein n=1 Tax=Ruminiclostridium sufflavum DSM 19573 TaxID=1121337 RepID=A0A318XJG5_9FIRM|nr:energy-coupling factor transporter transmembrane component T [Ruminiclostridium sufflavum]PYG84302.1 cobalt/nickel transport system permease protein [Ruminiclostridium sufflavum DSM 19573]